MAISLIATKATDSWSAATTTPALGNHTTTTGTDKVIVAAIAYYDDFTGGTVSAYTFNSVSGTRVTGTNLLAGGLGVDIWVVTLGSHTGASCTQSITFSATTLVGFVTLYELDGVDQTTPGVHGGTSSGGSGTQPSITIAAVAAGEFTLDTVSGFSGIGPPTVGADQTLVLDGNLGGVRGYSSYDATSTGSVVQSYTNDTGSNSMCGCSFAVASGGGGGGGSPGHGIEGELAAMGWCLPLGLNFRG